MLVPSNHDREISLTLSAAVALANALADETTGDTAGETVDVREILVAHEFSRASEAPAVAIDRVAERLRPLAPLLRSIPDADPVAVVRAVNDQISALPIAPIVTDHDGVGLHIHWTHDATAFDEQVLADFLMGLAQELCDNGVTRFGRCAADGCEHLFYDTTRNRSRRFCTDPRCASRTHTADHRARQRADHATAE